MSDAAMRWRLAGEDRQTSLLAAAGDVVVPRRDLPTVEYLHVQAKRIISAVPPQSRMPFRHTINAYRGCTHACTYCFARPTHTYLGMDGGRDFERRIVVKVNAVERLRVELADPRWSGDHIAMGTNTDPYQPAEGRYRLTRGLIEQLGEAGNPFSILTKSTMILRDLDVLVGAAARTSVRVNLSIGTLDEDVWRLSEPGTPPPARRLEAVRRLNEAGIPCGVLVAPVLPGLSDGPGLVERTVEGCLDAGAVSVSAILLHLRPGVRELFVPWLEDVRPDLLERYAELYARPGGYAARTEQEALTRRVHATIERHPRPPRPGRSWRTGIDARAARAVPGAAVVDRGVARRERSQPAQTALFG
jgi:DNA repair photolyase